MSIISSAMNQTITSISSVTSNEYNDKTTTVVYNDVRCRWQEKTSMITTSSGEEVTSRIQVWVMPTISVLEGYRVIKDDVTYVIVGYEKRYDLNGNHDHTAIFLN